MPAAAESEAASSGGDTVRTQRTRTCRGLGLPIGLVAALAILGCADHHVEPSTPSPPDPALHRLAVRTATATPDDPTKLAYWSSVDLAGPLDRRRAVIVVHGDERNADDYFAYAQEAARLEGSDALIVAPRFPTADDRPPTGDLRWTDASWKEGEPSESDRRQRGEPGVSSFEALDRLIEAIVLADPALEDVVIAGHSAGGQFVQRYAAGARLATGPRYRFVVANPSSYLYLDDRRPDSGEFRTPSARTRRSCRGFNDYKYGMEQLPPQMAVLGAARLTEQYRRRDVTILLGADDRSRGENLDESCAADLQGQHRFERGMRFYQYVTTLFPPSGRHQLEVVPDAPHDAEVMLTSEAGRAALFRGPGGAP